MGQKCSDRWLLKSFSMSFLSPLLMSRYRYRYYYRLVPNACYRFRYLYAFAVRKSSQCRLYILQSFRGLPTATRGHHTPIFTCCYFRHWEASPPPTTHTSEALDTVVAAPAPTEKKMPPTPNEKYITRNTPPPPPIHTRYFVYGNSSSDTT